MRAPPGSGLRAGVRASSTKPRGGCEDDDDEDDPGVDLITDSDAHDTRSDEQHEERTRELADQDRGQGTEAMLLDRVRSLDPQALGRAFGSDTLVIYLASAAQHRPRPLCTPLRTSNGVRRFIRERR